MGLIYTPWTSQPQIAAGVNWGNPISHGLGGLFDTRNAVELVYSNAAKNKTSLISATQAGLAADFSATANQQYSHRPGYAATGAVTIFAVVVIRSLSSYTAIISKEQTTTRNMPYELRLGNTSSDGAFTYGRANNADYKRSSASTSIASASVNLQTIAARSISGNPADIPDAFVGYIKTALSVKAGGATTVTDTGADVWIGRRFDGATQLNGKILYVAVWGRALGDSEIFSLTANPWQLFATLPRRIWAPGAAAGGDTSVSASPATAAADGITAALTRSIASAPAAALGDGITAAITRSIASTPGAALADGVAALVTTSGTATVAASPGAAAAGGIGAAVTVTVAVAPGAALADGITAALTRSIAGAPGAAVADGAAAAVAAAASVTVSAQPAAATAAGLAARITRALLSRSTDRTWAIAAQARTHGVAAQARTHRVGSESRTFTAQ
jgi:hypothetical protein